jgi:hypothetical protein
MSQITLTKSIFFDASAPLEMGWKLSVQASGTSGAPDRVFLNKRFFGPRTGFTGTDSDYVLTGQSQNSVQEYASVYWSESKFLRVAAEEQLPDTASSDPALSHPFPRIGSGPLTIASFGYHEFLSRSFEEHHSTWDSANSRYLEIKAGLLALVQVEESLAVSSVSLGVRGDPPLRNGTLYQAYPGDVIHLVAWGGSGQYSYGIQSELGVSDNNYQSSIDSSTGRFVMGPVVVSGTAKVVVSVTDVPSALIANLTINMVLPPEVSGPEIIQDV